MRVSRPCYDKMRRCPGWAGGGLHSAKVRRCKGGFLDTPQRAHIFEGRWWRWRFNRCPQCGILVLPYVVRFLNPTWWMR